MPKTYYLEVICKQCGNGRTWYSDTPSTAPRRPTFCPVCKHRDFKETCDEVSDTKMFDEDEDNKKK